MRTTVGVLLSIVMLFVGYTAISEQAQQSRPAAINQGTNATGEAFNLTSQVYDGVGQVFAPAVVWMGVAAIILVSAGYLVVLSQNGR